MNFCRNSYSRVSVPSWSIGAARMWDWWEAVTLQLEYNSKKWAKLILNQLSLWLNLPSSSVCIHSAKKWRNTTWKMQVFSDESNHHCASCLKFRCSLSSSITHTCSYWTFSTRMCAKEISSGKHLLQVCPVALKARAVWTRRYNPGLASLPADAL